jgi:hypothetical protein
MLQQPVLTYYLHVLNVESGSWERTTLGSPVSPRSVEAMNLILLKDGILAYIGTKLGFGLYEQSLLRDRETDMQRCWISLPASTISSKLGLCLNTLMSGKSEMTFYGSPLTVAIMLLLDLNDRNPLGYAQFVVHLSEGPESFSEVILGIGDPLDPEGRYLTWQDLNEALSYLKDISDGQD